MGLRTNAVEGQETKEGRDHDMGGVIHMNIEVLKT